MIPKTIHYCWLSEDPLPEKIQLCLQSWLKIMPDYKVKLWNTKNFDINHSIPFVREAFSCRKWAFVADYIRMYALYTEGGIYLDSDVKVLKRFDGFLSHGFFSSMEYHPYVIYKNNSLSHLNKDGKRIDDTYITGIEIQAAIMGAEKGHPFCKAVMDWYNDKHFINADGTMAIDIIAPQIYARIAESYGLRYKDVDQSLNDNMMIYRSEIFAGNRREATSASYAIHYCENSWKKLSFKEKSKHYLDYLCFLIKSRL